MCGRVYVSKYIITAHFGLLIVIIASDIPRGVVINVCVCVCLCVCVYVSILNDT